MFDLVPASLIARVALFPLFLLFPRAFQAAFLLGPTQPLPGTDVEIRLGCIVLLFVPFSVTDMLSVLSSESIKVSQ